MKLFLFFWKNSSGKNCSICHPTGMTGFSIQKESTSAANLVSRVFHLPTQTRNEVVELLTSPFFKTPAQFLWIRKLLLDWVSRVFNKKLSKDGNIHVERQVCERKCNEGDLGPPAEWLGGGIL